ncbi:MAG: NAD(P)H-hydrate dehydratase, partial [Bacteroidales bacterium]
MKIFPTQDIKAIEQFTINNEPISSLELMERAASAVTCEIISRWRQNKRIVVFAGRGNNGGDALAVARMLIEQGYRVEIFLFNIGTGSPTLECQANAERLKSIEGVDFTEITNDFSPPYLSKDDIVIDGLFGIGLREPLKGGFTALVKYINESKAYIVSIDLPSGVFGEWNLENNRRNIINADLTLTFQFPKLSFFFDENAQYFGEWKVLDIEFSQTAIANTPTDYYLVEQSDVKRVLRKRKDFSSKFDYGSTIIIGGCYGMIGAPMLATKAALKTGVGLATVHTPRCGYSIMQTSLPEAIFSADKHDIVITDIKLKHDYNSVGIGPGLGSNDLTVNALEQFLKNRNEPCIFDADALNCIAKRPSLLNYLPEMSIITPHSREFDRIFGEHISQEMRLRKAIEVARHYNIIVVLKSHNTMTIRPDGKIYINNSGTPALATPGSGDVLLGVISALVAQG